MVMIESVVRELADGYDISGLMKWPDQQAGRCAICCV
jgi:hypothetical protein